MMEQLLMVLVFALAAALCLGIFAKTDQMSQQTELRDGAVLLAQNGAETMKACAGDMEQVAQILGGTADGKTAEVQADGYRMVMTCLESDVPGLGQGNIEVYWDENLLYTIWTGWQEEGS
jgi:hypothetical protein